MTVLPTSRLAADGAAAELVRWFAFVDPGPNASGAQRAAAIRAVLDIVDEPDALHRAWTAAMRMLGRGEVTRSVVALLAEAMGASELAATA
jgi:hypothetical protein